MRFESNLLRTRHGRKVDRVDKGPDVSDVKDRMERICTLIAELYEQRSLSCAIF